MFPILFCMRSFSVEPLQNTQIIEILTNPQAHPTASQLAAVKTAKARQKIHAWLTAHDPTFTDKAKTETAQTANAQAAREIQETRRHKKGTGAHTDTVQGTGKIRIGSSTNFFVTFAQCCKPKYPDAIVGYISRNRGITVHRADCLTYRRIQDIEHRSIEIDWDVEKK